MQHPPKSGKESGGKDDTAREHGQYAEDESSVTEPRPREKGDYEDPGKHVTGSENASKGPGKNKAAPDTARITGRETRTETAARAGAAKARPKPA